MKPMTRRRFLKLAGRGAAGGLLFAQGGWLTASRGRPPSVLAVARGTDYGRLLTDALTALGGATVLARSGDHVVLKPTAAWNRPPHLAANTHPLVVQALAALCMEAGARSVTVFDRTTYRANLCYSTSGLAGALAQLRAPQVRLVALSPADFVAARDGTGQLCRYAVDADRLVNVPQAKHHIQRTLALGVTNLLGAVGGGEPLRDEFLVWALEQLRPQLTVLDATRLLVRNGPAGGDPADVERRDTLVVSRDPLAVDAYGCGLFGRDWRELAYLPLAARAGLGEPDLRHVRVLEG